MFTRVFEQVSKVSSMGLNVNVPLEIRVANAGDYAVKWTIYYYLKEVKNLLYVRQEFNEKILEESIKCGISLSTPMLHQLQNEAVLRAENEHSASN